MTPPREPIHIISLDFGCVSPSSLPIYLYLQNIPVRPRTRVTLTSLVGCLLAAESILTRLEVGEQGWLAGEKGSTTGGFEG